MAEINGVKEIVLKRIRNELGEVRKMLSIKDPYFNKFGEIYFSEVGYNKIKGWGLHKKMTLNLAGVCGEIMIVLFDDRENSPTKGNVKEIILNEENYKLLIVPPGIWMSFSGRRKDALNILANCATMPHDDAEKLNLNINTDKIPYNWKKLI